MVKLYIRNIKRGFATNSSSYHSTVLRYIDLPEYIWVQFKESEPSEKVETYNGGYSKGLVITDDEGTNWSSYSELVSAAECGIDVEDLGLKEGKSWVRIKFEASREY